MPCKENDQQTTDAPWNSSFVSRWRGCTLGQDCCPAPTSRPFVIFGTTAFFHLEINRSMRPEARVAPVSARRLMRRAGRLLTNREQRVRMAGPCGSEGAERGDGFYVSWLPKGVTPSQREQATLNPITGEPVTIRETQGGTFLYLFHYNLYYMPALWARYIVIAASLAMLVAILSGRRHAQEDVRRFLHAALRQGAAKLA